MNRPSDSPRIAIHEQPSPDWDAFVASRPSASIYLRSGWTLLAREIFGHEIRFFEARDAKGDLIGVLPLVRQSSKLLGNFATSLPFFNYGGALCDTPDVAEQLMQCARSWAMARGCAYVEFRDEQPRPGDWQVRTDKVSMVLPLPSSFEALAKQLGSKLRSQAKRADREEPSVRTGGIELVADFYDIFSRTMRDLGTPVYPRRFFEAILQRFPSDCVLLLVDCRGKPAAAAFLVMANGRAEIPWAACRDDMKPLGFNMKLYWEALAFVVGRGCTAFDFGRSTAEGGTYRFKKQWGAAPVPLYWHRFGRHAPAQDAPQPMAEGRMMRYAIAVWQRLPLQVANRVGPWVSPYLPW